MRKKDSGTGLNSVDANDAGHRGISRRTATDSTFEIERWHLAEIRAGLADADAGRVVSHDEIRALAATWHSRL